MSESSEYHELHAKPDCGLCYPVEASAGADPEPPSSPLKSKYRPVLPDDMDEEAWYEGYEEGWRNAWAARAQGGPSLDDIRLWLWNGCTHDGKYGDDGELQCRGADFRRDPIPTLIAHIVQAAQGGPSLSTEAANEWECGSEQDGHRCSRPAGHKGMHRKRSMLGPTQEALRAAFAAGAQGGPSLDVERLAATEWAYDTMLESFDVMRDPVEAWNDRLYPASDHDKDRYRRRAAAIAARLGVAPEPPE